MKQPTLEQRKEYQDIVENSASVVPIKGTKKSVKIRWMHKYTIERLTRLWIEKDVAAKKIESGEDVLKDLLTGPEFAFKEAALIILNNDLKIRFFYPFYWRYLAYKYDETQMEDVIVAGKKKLPLTAHYRIMAYSMDFRQDALQMTKEEAKQFQAELLSEAKRLSAKTSRSTDAPGGD